MRFGSVRTFLPQMAFDALAERVATWWDEWVWLWGAMFNAEERTKWRADQREQLDASTIEPAWHGGFAATSGGDEG